jgi:hypothetical protein
MAPKKDENHVFYTKNATKMTFLMMKPHFVRRKDKSSMMLHYSSKSMKVDFNGVFRIFQPLARLPAN